MEKPAQQAPPNPENRGGSGERDGTSGKFVKGRSGNPTGRPKIEGRIRKLAQRYSRKAILKLVELMESDNPRVQVAAATALLDRALGRPAQAIEVSTDPQAPPPQFNISFALGVPGNPLSPDEAAAVVLPPSSVSGDVEVSGDIDGSDLQFDESPLCLPEPNSPPVHASLPRAAEPPRLPPDPEHPNALTIDQHDGSVWKQLSSEPPSETRAQSFAKRQELLERRHREHQERNEAQRQHELEAQRIREASMRPLE